MDRVIQGQPIIAAAATGTCLSSDQPLSFWGGYDYHTGEIIDRRHPLSGQIAAGRVLAIPFARGSSTTTAVLLEAVKAKTAPSAILTTGPDHFFALASIVADEMYGTPFAVVALLESEFATLQTGMLVEVDLNGVVRVSEVE